MYSTYEELCSHTREAALLSSVQAVLEWDERTKLPAAGGEYRAEQVTQLAGLIHKKQTSSQVGEWLEVLATSPLAADPHSETGAVIGQLQRDYEKKTKLPQSLVEELAHTAVMGQRLWAEARKEDDFSRFQPLLEKTLDLKRQEATAVGFTDSVYDPLLDDYEPGAKTADVAQVLSELRNALVPLVEQIKVSDREPNMKILTGDYPVSLQEAFGKHVAEAIGFGFQAGRLDVTDHPFCTTLGPHDVCLATRYHEQTLVGGLFSTMHEAGHGIYEQGLPSEKFGLPTGEAVSLGIHESQSRMWENLVGRSHAFWEHFYPVGQEAFPAGFGDVSLDDFYFAINNVQPSLIRTEADEVTYNLHILIRFELEIDLLEATLAVADLPDAWNEKYRTYLGIEPTDDRDGVLQDVHWSAGLFGYFPTYSLGNLYAAQFFGQACQELGDLDDLFRKGQFEPLREWLRSNIHQHGRRYTPEELVKKITGKPLSHAALISHLRGKFGALYGLQEVT
jgi:carboxypeptidase Taq